MVYEVQLWCNYINKNSDIIVSFFVVIVRDDGDRPSTIQTQVQQLINLIRENNKNEVILCLQTNNPSKQEVFN